jgi:hypothetical protein
MAGSIEHTIGVDGKFIGIELIDNLGDAEEALEEYYHDRIKIQQELATTKAKLGLYQTLHRVLRKEEWPHFLCDVDEDVYDEIYGILKKIEGME